MSQFVAQHIDAIVTEAETVAELDPTQILGMDLAKLSAPLMRGREVPITSVLRLALLNDCLVVAEQAIEADGVMSEQEVDYVHPLASAVAPLLARLRASYGDLRLLTRNRTPHFLEVHAADKQPFGGACKRTHNVGFAACRQLAETLDDSTPVEEYESLMLRLLDELREAGGNTPAEMATTERLRELIERETAISELKEIRHRKDRRAEVFCDPGGSEVFHAIAHAEEVWTADPFDLESVHSEARRVFGETLERVLEPSSTFGRSLVVLGEAGAGKTHLLRAFRTAVHGRSSGYVAYLQPTSISNDYTRLLLGALVDSLGRAYHPPHNSSSGLSCLSDALVAAAPKLDPAALDRLREEEMTPDELGRLTDLLSSTALRDGLGDLHSDVVRAFLLLQRADPAIRQRMVKFLRCERLSPFEEELLGHITAWNDPDAPQRMLVQLGKLMWGTSEAALVILVDQIEDIQNKDHPHERFLELTNTLRSLGDLVPHSVVVMACLDDFYTEFGRQLPASVRDRLERDPPLAKLTASRNAEEVEAIAAIRLRYLYDTNGARYLDEEPVYPFPRETLQRMRNTPARNVLEWCKRYQQMCRAAGAIVDVRAEDLKGLRTATSSLENEWVRSLQKEPPEAPDTDAGLLAVIAGSVRAMERELDVPVTIEPSGEDALIITLDAPGAKLRRFVAVVNRQPQGGHLGRQLEEIAQRARAAKEAPAFLRTGEFPSRQGTAIAKLLGTLVREGASKVLLAEEEVRRLQVLVAFMQEHREHSELTAWAQQTRVVSQSVLGQLFDLSLLKRTQTFPVPVTPSSVTATTIAKGASGATNQAMRHDPKPGKPASTGASARELTLGRSRSLKAEPISLPVGALQAHVAVLGATNSGKTTLALRALEQVLLGGVPVLMVDRKGDLCTYADPDFWAVDEEDEQRSKLKRELQDRLDIRIYTPGESRGRPLVVPLAPKDLAQLPTAERGTAARQAAEALGGMLELGGKAADQPKIGILGKAIELLSESPENLSVKTLATLISERDPDLMNLVGNVFAKSHFSALAERLWATGMLHEQLLGQDGEQLRAEALFGLDGSVPSEKVRLGIISTRFLNGDKAIEFWIARLLGELSSWVGRAPKGALQAVVFLDEADLYLPATSKPATKEPMLDLLKRGRSAGLGVVLATQNPGDFDYKARGNINTWFLGRVSQQNDIGKMRALLAEARTDITGKLANAERGQFFMLRAGEVRELQADRSVMVTRQLGPDAILLLAGRER